MYFVYLLVTKIKNRTISYVGYTKDINKRLKLHNNSKGAKFTRGRRWKLAYSKKYLSKSVAMREEYKLKKNRIKRNNLKEKFLNQYENFNTSSI